MNEKMMPRSLWSFPSLRFPFSAFDEEDQFLPQEFSSGSGLSVYEDDDLVCIEACLPGVRKDDMEISYNKGALTILGEKKSEKEDRGKKFYRRARSSFAYRVAVPGDVDEEEEPEAHYSEGVLKVVFKKAKKSRPKKIEIKHK